jgi:anaerobic selenocysteine-containing dehydrogenase
VEQALKNLDFLAVADLIMTPTAKLADIVLPACTFLERTRFVTYDTHADHSWNAQSRIMLSPKVVEPLEESWSDWKIICELARKMGYREYFPWKTEEEAIDHMLKPLGLTCEALRKHPEGVIVPVPPFLYTKFKGFFGTIMRRVLKITAFRNYPNMYRKYESKGFMTPSKKVELYSRRLKSLGYDPLPVYRKRRLSYGSSPDLSQMANFLENTVPIFSFDSITGILSIRKRAGRISPSDETATVPEKSLIANTGSDNLISSIRPLKGNRLTLAESIPGKADNSD